MQTAVLGYSCLTDCLSVCYGGGGEGGGEEEGLSYYNNRKWQEGTLIESND